MYRFLIYAGLVATGLTLAPIAAEETEIRRATAGCPYGGAGVASECPVIGSSSNSVSALSIALNALPLLDLTSPQRARIAEILLDVQADLAPMQARIREAHGAFIAAIHAVSPNEEEIQRRTAEIMEIRAETREREGKALGAIQEVLTDAQLRELFAPALPQQDTTVTGTAL